MGFLDNVKDKAEDFGEKAKEGFEAAKDKASDLIDDVKDRFDNVEDDKTSDEKVDEALNYDPSAVDAASEEGISGAAAGVEPTLEPASDSSVDPMSPATDPMSPATDPLSPVADPLAPATDPMAPAAESMAPTQTPDDAYDVAEDFEPTPEPAAEPMEPTQTPDEAYDTALDDAAAKSEYRSDSTP